MVPIFSAPVFTLASQMLSMQEKAPVQVGACAVVAPQTADAFGIRDCAPTVPVLLVHGTNDRCLSSECSMRLKAMYENADLDKSGKCEVILSASGLSLNLKLFKMFYYVDLV